MGNTQSKLHTNFLVLQCICNTFVLRYNDWLILSIVFSLCFDAIRIHNFNIITVHVEDKINHTFITPCFTIIIKYGIYILQNRVKSNATPKHCTQFVIQNGCVDSNPGIQNQYFLVTRCTTNNLPRQTLIRSARMQEIGQKSVVKVFKLPITTGIRFFSNTICRLRGVYYPAAINA